MNKTAIKLLEFDKVKEKLESFAVSNGAKEKIKNLEPAADIKTVRQLQTETTEACTLIRKSSSIPLHSLTGMEDIISKLDKGGILIPEELTALDKFIVCCSRMKIFMKDKEYSAPFVSSFALSIYEFDEISLEIERCIVNGEVDDRSSSELLKIRKKLGVIESRARSRLDSIIRSPELKKYLQDAVVSLKDGRYVIPVKSEYRKNIKGSVVDTSSSGATVFIEPEDVRHLMDEYNILKIEEEREVYKILSQITAMVSSVTREISINMEIMVQYDFIFAKAKLSRSMEGRTVGLNDRGYIKIKGGKHPEIGSKAVPLNFEIGNGYKALVITGPNTGGKTVALKTVGLLTMMVQSGLHVPVEEGSEFSLFSDILVDIGDGQSIEQSLSTFSSHIRNIVSIIEAANSKSLVILDELGAGTDPLEGMGLAVSILETIYDKGSTMLATTHYSEIKKFAQERNGFENGCMEFDIDTLMPLYSLSIGKSGDSNAFLIALRLGMPKNIIEKAHEVTYKEKKEYSIVNESSDNKFVKNDEIIKSIEVQREKEESIVLAEKIVKNTIKEQSFKIGDCVFISSLGRTGIVCELENNKGEIGVMYMKKKIKVNKKRLSLYIDSDELYPENYNMDIVLESKENRRKKHIMDRKYVEGLTIEYDNNLK